MKFNEIKTSEDAYVYAEEKGGIPKVPFMRMWQFICHDEEKLILASKTMQEIFNLVDSECKFRIGEIKQIGESRFEVAISTGDSFEFSIGQTYLYNKLNAQDIEEKVAKAKKASPQKKDGNSAGAAEVIPEVEIIPEEVANAISEGIKKAEAILASAKEKEEVVKEQPLKEEVVKEQPLKEEEKVVKEQSPKEEVVSLKIFGLTVFEYTKK